MTCDLREKDEVDQYTKDNIGRYNTGTIYVLQGVCLVLGQE